VERQVGCVTAVHVFIDPSNPSRIARPGSCDRSCAGSALAGQAPLGGCVTGESHGVVSQSV